MSNDEPQETPSSATPAVNPDSTTRGRSSSGLSSLRISFAVVIVLTLLSGLVHGIMDGRWSASEDLIARGSRLQDLPEKCGDWSLIETRELDRNAADLLRCYGSEVRIYQHEPTETIITVALLFGPRGPIAVHTPEVCYSSLGTDQFGGRKNETIQQDKITNSFWAVQFGKKPSPKPTMDVWYAWSDGSEWIAGENPRFWLTNNLYKLQIAGPIGDDAFRPCKDFLRTFLPDIALVIE